ncbi:hypothetical protein F4561_004520 [Lipingzhangella halophila]|uniref:Uncharacterized protein n=1 Tax=Lipingzhangella halophila TaxID=1783352 RepID=A0A7W7RKL3_9ACTN|nr:hypothetical protein [Lipingzhangella halophila]MBB4933700.1 hypothetical protein [Lipingzhangella halophila]
MYGLIWRVLPGPWFVKFTLSLGLLAGAAALLWYVAFPELAPYMPFRDSAVDVEEPQSDGGAGQSQDQGTGEDDAGGGDGAGAGGGSGDTGNDAPADEEGIVGVDVPIGDDDS